MATTALLQIVSEVTKPRGYSRRGYLFWIRAPELTRILHIQRSRRGTGVYFNFGVIPTVMVTKSYPPGSSYLGLRLRATTWEGPYSTAFANCERAYSDRLHARAMLRPVAWLIAEIDTFLADPEWVRKVVLDDDCVESSHSFLLIRDWARGSLKHPRDYFLHSRYYL